MSTSLNLPKPITGILPSVDKYREDVLSQNLEEQDTLLSKTSPPDSARIKSRIGLTIETLAAIVLSILTVVIGLLAWMRVSASPQTDKLPNFSKLYTDCGSNYSTAFAAGCIFDIVAPNGSHQNAITQICPTNTLRKSPNQCFFVGQILQSRFRRIPWRFLNMSESGHSMNIIQYIVYTSLSLPR